MVNWALSFTLYALSSIPGHSASWKSKWPRDLKNGIAAEILWRFEPGTIKNSSTGLMDLHGFIGIKFF